MKTHFLVGLLLSVVACSSPARQTAAGGNQGAEPDKLVASPTVGDGGTTAEGALPAPGVVVVPNKEYWDRVAAGEETYDYNLNEEAKAQRASDTQIVLEDAAQRLPDAANLIVTEIPDDPTHAVTDNDGATHEVKLVDSKTRSEILRSGIELGDTAAAVDYNIIYDSASEAAKAQLTRPDAINTITIDHVRVAASIVASLRTLPPLSLPPAGYPQKWQDEVGSGRLLDHGRKLSQCGGERNPNGLFRNFDWPLKWVTTSIKDQASRGTCGAFALSSVAETREVISGNRYINVSEQDLYFRIRGPWALNWKIGYDEGTNLGLAVPAMILTGFRFAYEQDWDYNPSNSRTENPLMNSCKNYNGQLCTETYHQGIEECSALKFWECFAPRGVDIANRSNVHAIWGQVLGLPVLGYAIDAMKSALAAKKGVLFSFDVVPSFDHHSGGFVKFVRGEKSRGGHLVHMVGYVSNEELAQRLPSATPGSGGGYFILKNSWGECAGDGGYFYVPVDYVKTYGTGVTVVDMQR